jgi:uncharacterized membrane protein
MKVLLRLALACAVNVWFPLLLHAAVQYHFTNLGGVPPQLVSIGYGINSSGQVVGAAYVDPSPAQAFIATSSTPPQGLGVVPGFPRSTAEKVNDLGQAVGRSHTDDLSVTHATFWSGGVAQDLGNIPDSSLSLGLDINNAGQVLMYADIGGRTHYYIWTATDGYLDISSDPDWFTRRPVAIDNAGRVYGHTNEFGPRSAFVRTTDGQIENAGFLDSGAWIADVNENGTMIGSWSDSTFTSHSFILANGAQGNLDDLPGFLSTRALAINDLDQVVGFVYNPAPQRAIIWSLTEGIQDLNDLMDSSGDGFTLAVAWGINNAGQITSQIYPKFRPEKM